MTATSQFRIPADETVSACPKCGNSETFVARSEQRGDGFEILVECVCGHAPTGARLEDEDGVLDYVTIMQAMDCREAEM